MRAKSNFASSGQIKLNRPDKLRIRRTGGYADVELVYDGKTRFVRLLHRTMRSVVPTEAGDLLLERLGPALTEIESTLDLVNIFRDKPSGTLRLDVPLSAARLG